MEDPLSPHQIQFSGKMLNIGSHDSIDFNQYKLLSDSSIYDIELSAIDLAGNIAIPYKITDVLYDISEPIISEVYPPENSNINKDSVSYVLSEDIQFGEFRLNNMDEELVLFSEFNEDQFDKSFHLRTFPLEKDKVDGTVNKLIE